MQVEIDKNSGFCIGVVNAIQKAEEELSKGKLYCIGDIVHNQMEVERLQTKGLVTIDHGEFIGLKNSKVLFRAHGEPPVSYEVARRNEMEIIDASCPVVLKLQEQIREVFQKIKDKGEKILIYGKKGHAEVIGLVGQTGGEAIVIEKIEDLEALKLNIPLALFSQTTMNVEGFKKIAEAIEERGGKDLMVYDSICRKVANRISLLQDFAREHDVIIFVSGKKSSNGRQLFEICKATNYNSYWVENAEEVKEEMVKNAFQIGISGATSTPLWVMEEIKIKIESLKTEN
ncbi:MAG: 4-hydroxy-3-methylbut-2-enyl diphosphate reductase [Odoribacter sp.]|nr:4-hydroxy-3-methylbut-2-enyl diphosphate reductase [Odoribacter sp.]